MTDPTQICSAKSTSGVYRETGGETGHIWKEGSTILLLTTTGRKSGEPRTTPLIYAQDGERYVIVASKGGAPEHPGWYENLRRRPRSSCRCWAISSRPRAHGRRRGARAAVGKANEVWRHYDEYQTKTDREIPVVVLERRPRARPRSVPA